MVCGSDSDSYEAVARIRLVKTEDSIVCNIDLYSVERAIVL
jgi:hypothetical protein